jgi:hypothetical protein
VRNRRVREEPCDRPFVGRDQSEHGFLQGLVERRRLITQPKQQLARRIRVVQSAMGSRLIEAQLHRQERKTVAGGGRQKDASHIKGVEDLGRAIPEASRGQEVHVEPGPVPYRLAAVKEVGQLAQGGLCGRCPAKLLWPDPSQAEDHLRDGAAGIDQALERHGHAIGGESHRTHLDHSVSSWVQAGGLEVEGCVFGHRYADFTYGSHVRSFRGAVLRRVLSHAAVAIFAPDANRGDRRTQATGGPARTP